MNMITSWISGVLRGAGSTPLEDLNVQELTKPEDLTKIEEAAQEGMAFVFKHSTTCPVSASAHHRVAEYLKDKGAPPAPFFLVKVIESRTLSNLIAEAYGVRHQSPQLILIKGDAAVWDASHASITAKAIDQALDAAK